MAVAKRDIPSRRSSSRLLAGLGLAAAAAAAAATALSGGAAFLPGAGAAPSSSVAQRREFLAGGFAAAAASVAALQSPEAAMAKITEAVEVTGREGSRKRINGRWGIVFGKKINGKDVYKRGGENLYLLFNDCGQFQMSEEAVGTCNGFGVNNKGVWSIDGQEDKLVKVKPVNAGDLPVIKKVDPREIAMQELETMNREQTSETFRGVLSDDDELVGDRLMDKFGAKIKKGM